MPGLELCRYFYEEAVRPIVERRFPGLRWGAARIQAGSDVLGFDTPLSMDHGWGPMLTLFIAQDEYSPKLGAEINRVLAEELPFEIRGFPTYFGDPDEAAGALWHHGHMVMATRRPIKHHVGVGPERGVFRGWLGVDPLREHPLRLEEWLCIPSQQLRAFTSGAVYRDDTGEIARARAAVRWYPHDVWLYLLAAQWLRLGQEEAFMGRCGDVGDELGSRIVAARLVRDVMHLCFLIERQYPPYTKWFGSAFARLACAERLTPHLRLALSGETWREREQGLCAAYEAVAEMHNALGLTEPLDARVSPFHTRPYVVINAGRFWEVLRRQIQDPQVKRLVRDQHLIIGGVSQWADSTDVLAGNWREPLRRMYREAIEAD